MTTSCQIKTECVDPIEEVKTEATSTENLHSNLKTEETFPTEPNFTDSFTKDDFDLLEVKDKLLELQNGDITHPTRVVYKCELCSLQFADSDCLQKHFKMHKYAEKPYRCETCKKCFNFSGKLRHEKVHTRRKRYKCVVCGRCFNQSSILKSHLRVHAKR